MSDDNSIVENLKQTFKSKTQDNKKSDYQKNKYFRFKTNKQKVVFFALEEYFNERENSNLSQVELTQVVISEFLDALEEYDEDEFEKLTEKFQKYADEILED